MSALTVFRTPPQKSGTQVASNGSAYKVKVLPNAPLVEKFDEDKDVPVEEFFDLVTDGLIVAVGKYCERACLTIARAAAKLATAAATFWLEIITCSSSAFNSGSLNTSHHFPR